MSNSDMDMQRKRHKSRHGARHGRMKEKEEAGTCLDVNKVFLVVAIDILEWK